MQCDPQVTANAVTAACIVCAQELRLLLYSPSLPHGFQHTSMKGEGRAVRSYGMQ